MTLNRFNGLRLVLLIFTLIWMGVCGAHALHAQTPIQDEMKLERNARELERDNQSIMELERRLATIDEIKIAERLARLETLNETNRQLLYGIFVPVFGLAGEALLRLASSIMKARRSNGP